MYAQQANTTSTFDTGSVIGTLNTDAIIKEHEGYIRKLASKLIPQYTIRREVLDLELDELVQTILVKFWQALKKWQIDNYKSYLQRIVHNEVINLLRKSRFNQPLDIDEEGEPYYGNVLIAQNEETRDPLDILVEKETISERIHCTIETVITFPPSQRKATLCNIKDRIDYTNEFLDALQSHDIDVQQLTWADGPEAAHSMKVCASLGRKKLKASQKTPVC